MDLEVARKSLSKRSAFPTKKIAFAAVAGLALVMGIAWRASHHFGGTSAESQPAEVEATAPAAEAASPSAAEPSVADTPPATEAPKPVVEAPPATEQAAPVASEPAPPAQPAGDTAEQTAPQEDAAGQAEQAELPGAGMILVARKPVEVLASPSASAPAMYGFPAGRPFRVIGRQGGFVQIQDLRSSASGWIDETALAAPPRAPAAAAPSQPKPGAAGRKPATAAADPKPKAANKPAPSTADAQPAPEPESAPPHRPSVLFGRGGFFGGIFGGGN